MGGLYGKPKDYPYYFNIYFKGKRIRQSGVFKTKKVALASAKRFTSEHESFRIVDRRRKH